MLHLVDWAVILAYIVFVLWVGVAFARRAGTSLDEYFLSGRSLPWWIAGTSMVATSFAADTPLLISGWVRDGGIAKNWVWWCYAVNSAVQIWFFARWWRRAGVMTKAELAELRYGGTEAEVLRGMLGMMHAWVMSTLTIAWVLLAAQKISQVVFGLENEVLGLALACTIALVYSLLAGFWGVVVTDLVQFVMAMTGAIALAVLAWQGVGGSEAILAAQNLDPDNLRFLPSPGSGGVFDGDFWTTALTAVVVALVVQWWAVENVDGSSAMVQRVAASKDERHGMLATLWFSVAHYALRPWCWIAVGLASLVLLPRMEFTSPVSGVVVEVASDRGSVRIEDASGESHEIALADPREEDDWRLLSSVGVGDEVTRESVIGATDPELAYLVMMRRFLPIGLFGLVAASLMAAFMSTIDTHVNLAASFFINDVYRRFIKPDASTEHYLGVARMTCAGVLLLGALVAANSGSVRALFTYFLAFGSGVGLIYVLRWFWWRIRAATEIAAMLTSAVTSTLLTLVYADGWSDTALTPDGVLSHSGRLLIVVAISISVAFVVTLLLPKPDPAKLVAFYERVRPPGLWGPVRALCPDAGPGMRLGTPFLGSFGSLALIFGAMAGIGFLMLGRMADARLALGAALIGAGLVFVAIRRLDKNEEYVC